ncbi:MFS transporter [Xenorhabdus poinarii]|nr:MFS transporter [Xenorhabdus poinarii]
MKHTSVADSKNEVLPFAVYILTFGIFAMVTSEFQVAGMIPVMASDLGVSISQAGLNNFSLT